MARFARPLDSQESPDSGLHPESLRPSKTEMTPMQVQTPALTPAAVQVLEARYLRREDGRVVESPQQMFQRVADAVAAVEARWGDDPAPWATRFRQMMERLDFLPNSPTLMNAGLPDGQLSACFVLPVDDSMDGIFTALHDAALVQKTGGGTGFSFSRLRPHDDVVHSTSGLASGPVPFMRIFDTATGNIRQGGRRRGANMGILRVDHPDIRDFIRAKREGGLENFNLSVSVTDAFMEATVAGGDWPLLNPRTGDIAGHVDARALWTDLCDAAWATGDPGLVFLDAIHRADPTPHLGTIEATNPCGELPLLPNEACTLGSINLAHYVENGALDLERLRGTVHDAVRFLDDVIDANHAPTPAVAGATGATRKIGLGVMGFAEMLVRLGVPYDHPDAVQWAEDVMGLIQREALAASQALAGERGAFPAFTGSLLDGAGPPVRNATRTAVAPTGTISIIAGTTPGIEPMFALAYRRVGVLDGQTLPDVHPLLAEVLRERGIDAGPVLAHVARTGHLGGAEGVPDDLRRLFRTALEVSPERHLDIQAAFQRHTDSAVSKTVNLPNDAGPDVVAHVYHRAWRLGCKGITVYRYGSKDTQVLELGTGQTPETCEHTPRCDPGECRL